MGILEEVMDLRNKKVPDNEIIGILKERGLTPKSISDALSQAKIKSAVSSQGGMEEGMEPSLMGPEGSEDLPTEGSISDEDLTPLPSGLPPAMQQRGYVPMHKEEGEEDYVPQPQAEYSPQQYAQTPPQYNQSQYSASQYQPEEYSPQEYVPQEQGTGYEYQPQAGGSDTDTIIEISEQVFADKMKRTLKHLESLNEFKTLSGIKLENVSERLKRIESSIDRLQMSILEKVGSYGRGLDTVKKEMEMVQDSFSKIVNVAAEKSNKNGESQIPSKKHHQQHSHHHATQEPTHHTIHRTEKKTTVVHKSAQGKNHSKK